MQANIKQRFHECELNSNIMSSQTVEGRYDRRPPPVSRLSAVIMFGLIKLKP
jgi:hypothetical protein